jgi:hypothetical protein
MKTKTIRVMSVVLLALSLASLACAIGAEPTPPPVPSTPIAVVTVISPTLSVEPTVALPPTPEPNATAISIPGPTVTYNHITLTLDINLARGVGARISPAEQDGELPFWALRPEYTEFMLDGYPIVDRPAQATRINIFPVDQLQAIAPDEYGQAFDQLRALINTQSASPDKIPTIPFINAGEVYHAQVHYLATASVKGIAFIGQYAQFPAAVNNRDAIYIFEGFTNDEQFYIQATLPVNAPGIGFAGDDFSGYTVDFGSNDFTTQYQAYLDTMLANLNALTPDQFTPNLNSLDALVGSVTVGQ